MTQTEVGHEPAEFSATHIVEAEHLAVHIGSGDVKVLATPVLVSWLEHATCGAIDLAEHETSVGVNVSIDHTAPSAVGATITTSARLISREGRTARFSVEAQDRHGVSVAHGEIVRVVVNREKFNARVPQI